MMTMGIDILPIGECEGFWHLLLFSHVADPRQPMSFVDIIVLVVIVLVVFVSIALLQ